MSNKNKLQQGFSLIEILISLLLLGVGLLGAIALQATSLKEGQVSNYRSNATLIAHSVLDQIRANSINASNYNIDRKENAPAGNAVFQRDLQTFKNAANTLLPNGDGFIEIDKDHRHVTITLEWRESKVTYSEEEKNKTDYDLRTFVYASEY